MSSKPSNAKSSGALEAAKPEAAKSSEISSTAELSKQPKGGKVVRDRDLSQEIAVSFTNVVKEYSLYRSDRARFLGVFFKRVPHDIVRAADNLSFEIKRGDAVALFGDNGAGKSTALKMITGVCHPTSGIIEVHGRVSALLELSAGFDNKLTGRENIAMRSQIWGLSKEEAAELEPEIVEFAEIGKYIDQPMRTYSSGMRARLGFAFASSISPDILIVDEALSVGDRKFSQKCRDRVSNIIARDGTTVLLVTHSVGQARQFCQRGIVLEHGKSIYNGDIEEAIAVYEK